MSVDLHTQIHDYADYFGSKLPAIDLNALISPREAEGLVETAPQGRPRWMVTAAAAIVVLFLIGIAAVASSLLGSDPDPVIDSPATTTLPATTSTLPPVVPQALPSTFQDSNGTPLGEATLAEGITSSDPAVVGVLETVTEQLLSDPSFGLGASRQEREQRLLGCAAESPDCAGLAGGMHIHLALDWDLQRTANEILDTWLTEATGVVGSIVMIDNETGAIRVSVEPNVAAQPGSVAKLFPLVAALESGIGLNSMWDISSPMVLEIEGGEWTVIGGRVEGGERSLEASTYFSTNVTFAQIGVEVGPEAMAEVADRLGVSTELPAVYSLALGAVEVSPLDMATAYSTIANYGERVQPHLVERIVDTDGTVLHQAATPREQVIDPALAAAIVNTLKKVVIQGTGTAADIGRPQAGKTGSTPLFTDSWFVGFTPRFTTAVRLGTTDRRPMTNLTMNGLFYSRVFGGSVPAPIWAEFMSIALAELPIEQFDVDPAGTDAYYSQERPTGQ